MEKIVPELLPLFRVFCTSLPFYISCPSIPTLLYTFSSSLFLLCGNRLTVCKNREEEASRGWH